MIQERQLVAAIKKYRKTNSGTFCIILQDGAFEIGPAPPPDPRPPLLEISCEPSIYFLEAFPLTRIKIGFVNNGLSVFDRIKTLQTGRPYELGLFAIIPGSQQQEHYIHAAFAEERLVGEWFEPSDRLNRFIDFAHKAKMHPFAALRELRIP